MKTKELLIENERGWKKLWVNFAIKIWFISNFFCSCTFAILLTPWLQLNKKNSTEIFHAFAISFAFSSSAALLKRWKLCMQVVYCRLNAFIECWTAECLSLDSYWRRRRRRCHRWERKEGICMQMAKNVKIVIQGRERYTAK